MPSAHRIDPFLAGNFRVDINGITSTSFSEVCGLEAEIEIVDYRNGDEKQNAVRKLPGLNKYSNVVLKRGITADQSLWNWLESALNGNIQRANVVITLLDLADNPVWICKLSNAWPCKWTGPVLIAQSSEVAIETLEIAHEGLELAQP